VTADGYISVRDWRRKPLLRLTSPAMLRDWEERS
jgi:hypothetical protein